MPYKKKLLLLGSTAALLALVYILTLLLDPARANARNERFTWLPSGSRDMADRIEITKDGDKLELVLRNGAWFAIIDSMEIPVKQGRVDDLFRLLSTRGIFPLRGSNAASHAELGLDGSARLVIRGGAGLPLLDLLAGKDDPSGREVFLRKNGENEFRSGDRLIGTYITGEKTSWFDMNLFDETSITQVQRMLVRYFDYYGTGDEISELPYSDFTITRSGEDWIMDGALNKDTVESWIWTILEAQGENILPPRDEFDGSFAIAASIRIELGDGSALELEVEQPGEDGKSCITVGGKPYRFVFSRWITARLLRSRESFRN